MRRATCGGTRAAELALRLKYAGVPRTASWSAPTCARRSTAALAADGGGPLFVLPTYTAMLALREVLVRRGAAAESFGMTPDPR